MPCLFFIGENMLNKTKVNISSGLVSDLKKYLKEVCVGCATYCRDELTSVAEQAINNFYADYSPIKYKRHYTNFQKNSFIKYYNNPHNQIIRGGVELTPNSVENVYYGATGAQVFDFVYAGYHGVSSAIYGNPSPMNPSPREEIEIAQLFLANGIDTLKRKGIERANGGGYQQIRTR